MSLELIKPDIDLISGFHKTASANGYSTTFVFSRNDVPMTGVIGSSTAYSTLGSLRWTITVGSQGEVEASTVVEKTRHATTTLNVTVLSYNQPTHIDVPSATNTQPLSTSMLAKLLKSVNFNSVLIPSSVRSLGQSTIS